MFDPPTHLGVNQVTFRSDHLAEPVDCRSRQLAFAFELLEGDEGDVELADESEGAREALYYTLEFVAAGPGGDERQRFAQAPRGHARLMDRAHVAAPRGGKSSRQRHETLADHQFRWAGSLHVTGTLIFRPSHPKMQFTS